MYSVLIIGYEDDYKHRDDSGVYTEDLKLFMAKENAEKYVADYIYEYLLDNEYIDEMEKVDFKQMTELHKIHCKGEYVDYIFEYNIQEITFEDDEDSI